MAAGYRKFYYDWSEGKYKMNQKNFHFAKKLVHRPVQLDAMNMEDDRFPGSMNELIKNEDLFIKQQFGRNKINDSKDNVDAGRLKPNERKSQLQAVEEISKGHEVMVSVMNTRLLRLNAAQTLWNKDMNSFIAYILRLNDEAVLVDLLPVLTKQVKGDGPECSSLSMGACLDLLPILGNLVESKYEDYIVASMDMIREVMKRWWKELQTAGKKEKEEFNTDFRCSRSVSGVYMLIISMTDRIKLLSKRSGKVGEKAKVLYELMALI